MATIRSLIVAIIVTLPAFAQSPNPKIDAVRLRMQQFVNDGEIAGAVVCSGTAKGDLLLESVGLADVESKRAMTADTVFRIASMTKPITAMGVMLLAEDGRLSPDDPVEKYLPEFKGQMLSVKTGDTTMLVTPDRPVTLRDLMTHTSGLNGNYGSAMAAAYTKRNFTLAETTAAVAKMPLVFPPGSKWSYCNPGIDTLGRVIEVVSGRPYDKFLKDRIFDPLGMTNTTPYPNAEQLAKCAITYSKQEGKLVAAKNTLIDFEKDAVHPIPAGGLFSTAGDLAKLYRCLLNKGTLDGKTIIKPETLALMTRTQTGDIKTGFTEGMSYGFGFAVVKSPLGVTAMLSPGTFGHGGAFGTQGWIDPVQGAYFILLIQRNNLGNSDGSSIRGQFQTLAVDALKSARP
jgi:CubicO group peptidase (beta-lactamase class C family)